MSRASNFLRIAVLAAVGLLSACDENGIGFLPNDNAVSTGTSYKKSGEKSCSVANRNKAIYDYMRDKYFWADKVSRPTDLLSYTDPRQLLKTLRYSTLDKWSFLFTLTQADEFFSGEATDYGLKLVKDNANAVALALVHPQSNAYKAGLRRGDVVLSINGESLRGVSIDRAYDLLYSARSASLLIKGGPDQTVTVNVSKLSDSAVVQDKVIDASFGKVGYLLYTEFTEKSESTLSQAFARFKAADVSQLVIDLRYNPGGTITTAAYIGGLIGGKLTNGKLFERTVYNSKHQNLNHSYLFANEANSLGINSVVVLASSESCSASEALISGLKPFINVTVIGDTTCGKPVGMHPEQVCDVVMVAINFEGFNANGEGRFYKGIPADCRANDDVTHQLGDAKEGMLAAALGYLRTGECLRTVVTREIPGARMQSSHFYDRVRFAQ